MAFAIPSQADRLFYKSGQVLEGLVQEQYPSRIKFLYRDQSITIPRSRIERIELESVSEAIQAFLTSAAAAIQNFYLDQAASQLSEADTRNGPRGAFRSQIQELQSHLSILRSR